MSQLPFGFIVPESKWKAPSMSDLPQDWNVFPRMAWDTEGRDDTLTTLGCGARRGAYICGHAIGFEDGPAFYLPTRHTAGGNMDPVQVERYMRDQAANYRGTLVGANLQHDLDMGAQIGIEWNQVKAIRDVQIAEPLLDENQFSYSLDAIGERRLGQGKVDEQLNQALLAYAPKKTAKTKLKAFLHLLPPEQVGGYAEGDVTLPLRLIRAQERELDAQDLWGVYDLESRLLPALVRMRRRGVRVDQDKLTQIEIWAAQQEGIAWDEVARLTGVRIPVGAAMEARKVARALDAVGITYQMVGKKLDQPSITKELLERVNHPVGDLIRRARKMSQLRSTFVASVRAHLTNGRIHCTLNQLRKSKDSDGDGGDGGEEQEGGRYGRLSCTNPNLQQQPARDEEIGPMWRSIYLPEEGTVWASKDFSQQEPKWLIHASCQVPVGDPKGRRGKLGLTREASEAAHAMAAQYRENPNLDCYDAFTRVAFGTMSKELRKVIKEVYLGRCYGMGVPKMTRKLGHEPVWGKDWKGRDREVAPPEAQAKIDKFDGGVPYAREMAQLLESLAKTRGYIKTHSGRRCRSPKDDNGEYEDAHKMLNRLIQGSSADETKESVVQLDAAGYFIQLQVHDEVDGSYESREQAEKAADIMRYAVPKCLPTKVDVECGRSWGEAK